MALIHYIKFHFQYQFDGNSNLVYTIIRKRQVFHALANLPTDCNTIAKSLSKRQRRYAGNNSSNESISEAAMEGSRPALPAEPGTLKATLLETPGILVYLFDYLCIPITNDEFRNFSDRKFSF